MTIGKTDIIGKIRKAIDDIAPSLADSFTEDTNNELWQATLHAVQQLLMELPLPYLAPQTMAVAAGDHTQNADGSGIIKLNSNFLRFIGLKLTSWPQMLMTLIEPDSDEAVRQRTLWGRGTPEKPKAMPGYNTTGAQTITYWTAGKSGNSYNHNIEQLMYIPKATSTTTEITCALKDIAERIVIARAAYLFFEGKKEMNIAEKFKEISTNI